MTWIRSVFVSPTQTLNIFLSFPSANHGLSPPTAHSLRHLGPQWHVPLPRGAISTCYFLFKVRSTHCLHIFFLQSLNQTPQALRFWWEPTGFSDTLLSLLHAHSTPLTSAIGSTQASDAFPLLSRLQQWWLLNSLVRVSSVTKMWAVHTERPLHSNSYWRRTGVGVCYIFWDEDVSPHRAPALHSVTPTGSG